MKKFLYLCIALVWVGYIVWKRIKPATSKQLPRPVAEIVTGNLVNARMQAVPLTKAPYYLIYFSAHWCPPCRQFTPRLASFYKNMKKANNFEVIFVSNDRGQNQMAEYMRQMPWPAVKYRSAAAQELSRGVGESGIPNLVVVNSNGESVYSTFVDGDYKGPDQVLQQFKEQLKNRPLAVQAVEMAKDLKDQNDQYIDKIESIRRQVENPGQHPPGGRDQFTEGTKRKVPLQVERLVGGGQPQMVMPDKQTPEGNQKRSPKVSTTKIVSKRARKPEKEIDPFGLSGFNLNGIAGNDNKRHAIINGKLYSVGDELTDGLTVKQIEANYIIVDDNGKDVRLTVK